MSPNPLRATMTLVKRSGMDVPAAKKVKPITAGGILKALPVTVAHHAPHHQVGKDSNPYDASSEGDDEVLAAF